MTHRLLTGIIRTQPSGFHTTSRDVNSLQAVLIRSDIAEVLRDGLCVEDPICVLGTSYLEMGLVHKIPEALLGVLVAACHEQVDGLLIQAIRYGAPEALVIDMLCAWPAAAEEMFDGWPALLFAIQRRMFALAAALLTAYPAAARVRRRGSSVLLYILTHQRYVKKTPHERPWMADPLFVQLLMQLLDVWPGAANCCDLEGNVPLALALQITVVGDVALYPVGPSRFGACVGRVALVLRLVAISPSSARAMFTISGHRISMLMLACSMRVAPWPHVVLHALIQASPETVALQCGAYGNTPLHVTIGAARRGGPDELPVIKAMIVACPGALRVQNVNGHYPLHHALRYAHCADAKLAILAADRGVARKLGSVYSAFFEVLNTNPLSELDPRDNAVICAVFDASFPRGIGPDNNNLLLYSDRIGRNSARCSLLRVLMRPYGRSPPDDEGMCDVARRLIAAIMSKGDSRRREEMAMGALALSILARAANHNLVLSGKLPPLDMLVAVIEAGGRRVAPERCRDGSTALHYVVGYAASKDASATTVNVLCRLLLRLGVCPTTVNRDGLTAVEAACAWVGHPQFSTVEKKRMHCALNHMILTLNEHTKYVEGPRGHPIRGYRLSCLHRRHWSTIMHQHCAPSAKLVVLVVLLVGETYKRKILPRLPMDCYYRILYNLDRSQLRVGACWGADEEAARATYASILKAAKPE